jgi:hypothetical protein
LQPDVNSGLTDNNGLEKQYGKSMKQPFFVMELPPAQQFIIIQPALLTIHRNTWVLHIPSQREILASSTFARNFQPYE